MTIVLREIPRVAADAILALERPGNLRVADDYPDGVLRGRGAVRRRRGAVGLPLPPAP